MFSYVVEIRYKSLSSDDKLTAYTINCTSQSEESIFETLKLSRMGTKRAVRQETGLDGLWGKLVKDDSCAVRCLLQVGHGMAE